jgi:hypothetical protein
MAGRWHDELNSVKHCSMQCDSWSDCTKASPPSGGWEQVCNIHHLGHARPSTADAHPHAPNLSRTTPKTRNKLCEDVSFVLQATMLLTGFRS